MLLLLLLLVVLLHLALLPLQDSTLALASPGTTHSSLLRSTLVLAQLLPLVFFQEDTEDLWLPMMSLLPSRDTASVSVFLQKDTAILSESFSQTRHHEQQQRPLRRVSETDSD